MSEQEPVATDQPRIIEDSIKFASKYRIHIAIAVGILVVIAMVTGFWIQNQETRRHEARALLVNSDNDAGWLEIIRKFPDTPAGAEAYIKLAQNAHDQQSYEDALDYYERFIEEFPMHPVRPAAEYARALCLEGLGNTDEAEASLVAIKSEPGHPYAGGASVALARIYLQKDDTLAARQVLSDFIATDQSSAFLGDARQMLRTLPLPQVPATEPVTEESEEGEDTK
jgi:tetratricopeptide (TPR) repeat protein